MKEYNESEFKNIGYYIVEPVKRPTYISLEYEELLSVSPCICDMHPNLSGCFWKGHEKEKKAYQESLSMTCDEFAKMAREVSVLFQEKRMDVDCRFVSLSDAAGFYQRHLKGRINVRIVSIWTLDRYISSLLEEALWGQNAAVSLENTAGALIGGEILGFDYGSFHSYLCNGLEKDIREAFHALFSPQTGLLQNDFAELERFAEHIQGKGEPVDWIPVLIREHTLEE